MKFSKALTAVALSAGLILPATFVAPAAYAVSATPSASATPVANVGFADVLEQYNEALAVLNAANADATVKLPARQSAYAAAKLAYAQLVKASLVAKQQADKDFRLAVKAANDANRASKGAKGLTADQKLAAQNTFVQALNDAAAVRDAAYQALVLPPAPTQPSKPTKPGKGKN